MLMFPLLIHQLSMNEGQLLPLLKWVSASTSPKPHLALQLASQLKVGESSFRGGRLLLSEMSFIEN